MSESSGVPAHKALLEPDMSLGYFSYVLCCTVAAAVLSQSDASLSKQYNSFIKVSANRSSALLTFGDEELRVELGREESEPEECEGSFTVCILWGKLGPLLTVARAGRLWRLHLRYAGSGASVSLDLTGVHLYGGPVSPYYPAENYQTQASPYVTGFGRTGAVAERRWFKSNGSAILVRAEDHLFVSQGPQELKLSFLDTPPYPKSNNSLIVDWCLGGDARGALKCFPQTVRMTDSQVIKEPIWSTWVRYKRDVSQLTVLSYAEEIKNHSFPPGTMEIDDKWETCYGNHQWDLKKFPNPRAMVAKLKSEGMKVTLWVHPFINTDCSMFNESADYLYKRSDGSVAETTWWNGQAGLVDFTNPRAVAWFSQRLKALKEAFGLTGFKFDAGEASYIAGLSDATTTLKLPNSHTTNYVNMAAKFGVMGEVRVGAGNTQTELFQRLQDTDSVWSGERGGLGAVIPSVLTLNVLGYAAVLPDMVGGNMYSAPVSKELFIRWLQLNTFLPAIQFSVPPWHFDNETVELSRELTALHNEYSELILSEIQSADHSDGHRVISPVWWFAPEYEPALTTDSEFLLGTEVLVAPVVEEGAVSRDIVFPSGQWRDPRDNKTYSGPTVLKDYPAPLHILPYFIRVNSSSPEALQV